MLSLRALCFAGVLGFGGASLAASLACNSCPIGAEGCSCTGGGGCDSGLMCLSDTCVDPNSQSSGYASQSGGETVDYSSSGGSNSGDTGASAGEDSSATLTTTGGSSDGEASSTTGATSSSSSTGSGSGGDCNQAGCSKVDMLFAIDGSGSMQEEINALVSSTAFLQIVDALEALNCGGIDYRIGVTNDESPSFITGPGWGGSAPWFDSSSLSKQEMQSAFSSAAPNVSQGTHPLGCEHVLSNSVALLQADTTGFVREDALLVLVMITDVDDYGAYDNQYGNDCGVGCTVTGQPVSAIQNALLAIKGGDPAGLAAIVIAGDPNAYAGDNFCGQPQSCATQAVNAFHATRLYEFAGLQTGSNGVTYDVCQGAQFVPDNIRAALEDSIDLACQTYIPID